MADGEEVEVKNDLGGNGAVGEDAADDKADGTEKGDGEGVSLITEKSDQLDEVVTEDANADVVKAGAGAGVGVDEDLSEQMECDKGSDDQAVEGDLGGMVSVADGDDVVNHDDEPGKGVGSENVDDVDQVKESTIGEADLNEQRDAVETRQSEEMITDDAEHKDECVEKDEVGKTLKKEEDAVQKMESDEAKAVQANENKIIAGRFGENGSRNSPVYDFNSLEGNDSGDEDEQSAFIQELENFFKVRNMEFKPPKFYQEDLNCLKLWRAVIREGGYDQVTTSKLWRHVGETFNPPKTCTTVSWSFRGFYEKALVEYERYLVETGELQLSPNPRSLPSGSENQKAGSSQPGGSGRAKRDSAARSMQGWHSQSKVGNEEEKSSVPLSKREKQLKTINEGKRKRHSSDEQAVKAARTKLEGPRSGQPATPVSMKEVSIKDIGPAAEWVKINVRKNAECWEIYALVPGLLREEVRVQSDPAGRLVISGEPEQTDNPWGVTPFKKVITLPSRINPHQTTAVVTLHGQLFVRSPFEQQAS